MGLKVLFCIGSYPVFGGVQRWLSELYFNLPKYGINAIIALAWGEKYNDPKKYASVYPGMRYIAIDGRAGTQNGRRIAVEKVIKKTQPDVVIPVLLHDALIGAIRRRQKGQIFYIVYPLHHEHQGVIETAITFRNFIDYFVSVNHLLADAIISIAGIDEERVSVIRSGVQRPLKNIRNRKLNLPIRLGYCGRLESSEHKRIFDLVLLCEKLIAKNHFFSLKIAGDGSAAHELIKQLNHLKQNNKFEIEYLGFLANEDLYNYFYPNIDILLLTSTWETGPIVIWEAMINGVVPVTSRYSGLVREGLLKHKHNSLLFTVGDMNSASNCIQEFISDPELLQHLSGNAIECANNFLTKELMIKKWFEMFNDLQKKNVLKSSYQLSPEVSHESKLERIGFPPNLAAIIRKIIGKHVYCDVEWPYYAKINPNKGLRLLEKIKKIERNYCEKSKEDDYIDRT